MNQWSFYNLKICACGFPSNSNNMDADTHVDSDADTFNYAFIHILCNLKNF